MNKNNYKKLIESATKQGERLDEFFFRLSGLGTDKFTQNQIDDIIEKVIDSFKPETQTLIKGIHAFANKQYKAATLLFKEPELEANPLALTFRAYMLLNVKKKKSGNLPTNIRTSVDLLKEAILTKNSEDYQIGFAIALLGDLRDEVDIGVHFSKRFNTFFTIEKSRLEKNYFFKKELVARLDLKKHGPIAYERVKVKLHVPQTKEKPAASSLSNIHPSTSPTDSQGTTKSAHPDAYPFNGSEDTNSDNIGKSVPAQEDKKDTNASERVSNIIRYNKDINCQDIPEEDKILLKANALALVSKFSSDQSAAERTLEIVQNIQRHELGQIGDEELKKAIEKLLIDFPSSVREEDENTIKIETSVEGVTDYEEAESTDADGDAAMIDMWEDVTGNDSQKTEDINDVTYDSLFEHYIGDDDELTHTNTEDARKREQEAEEFLKSFLKLEKVGNPLEVSTDSTANTDISGSNRTVTGNSGEDGDHENNEEQGITGSSSTPIATAAALPEKNDIVLRHIDNQKNGGKTTGITPNTPTCVIPLSDSPGVPDFSPPPYNIIQSASSSKEPHTTIPPVHDNVIGSNRKDNTDAFAHIHNIIVYNSNLKKIKKKGNLCDILEEDRIPLPPADSTLLSNLQKNLQSLQIKNNYDKSTKELANATVEFLQAYNTARKEKKKDFKTEATKYLNSINQFKQSVKPSRKQAAIRAVVRIGASLACGLLGAVVGLTIGAAADMLLTGGLDGGAMGILAGIKGAQVGLAVGAGILGAVGFASPYYFTRHAFLPPPVKRANKTVELAKELQSNLVAYRKK